MYKIYQLLGFTKLGACWIWPMGPTLPTPGLKDDYVTICLQ